MTPPRRIRLSVYYGPAVRAVCAVIGIVLFVLSASLVIFQPDVNEPGEEWAIRGVAAIPLATAILLLEVVLFDIRLRTDNDRLVKRGVWRSSVDLRTARFRLIDTTWQVMVRLSPLSVKRFDVTAPTLVVRSGVRRIKVPLARRFGHPIVNGEMVTCWLPEEQLGALVYSIERSAIADNKAKVVTYLRQLQRLSATAAPRQSTRSENSTG